MSEGTVDVPRPVLVGVGVLMIVALVLAGTARAWRDTAPPPAPLEVYEVTFEDRPDGTLLMREARTGREARVLPPGGSSFVRGVLRGMFRARKLESLGRDARFRLAREVDGTLSLGDPQTDRRISLEGFGATNRAAFAELLDAARQVSK